MVNKDKQSLASERAWLFCGWAKQLICFVIKGIFFSVGHIILASNFGVPSEEWFEITEIDEESHRHGCTVEITLATGNKVQIIQHLISEGLFQVFQRFESTHPLLPNLTARPESISLSFNKLKPLLKDLEGNGTGNSWQFLPCVGLQCNEAWEYNRRARYLPRLQGNCHPANSFCATVKPQ